jgi:beta-glucanase (GH16 family)
MSINYLNYLGLAMPTSSPTSKTFWGNGKYSNLVGGGVDDTFYVWSQDDNIVESAGAMATDIAAIYGSYQYILPANVVNLTISGTVSTAIGNGLSNLIIAQGATNLTIDGDGGNDVVVANTGADIVVMDPGYGHQVIYNFNPTNDVVRLANFGIDSFAVVEADMAQVGQDVVITLDANDSVILRNTTVASLSAKNFQLSINPSSAKMTFDDEFDTFTSSPNGSQGWMTTFPYPGASARSNGGIEYYSDSSVGVNPFSDTNGVLSITAAPGTQGVQTPLGSGLTYTSGLITTYKSFSQLYGYFEVRAQLPTGSGFWPAFWLLPANNTWPPELDVFEMLGNDPNTVFETAHTNVGGTNTMTHFNTYLADASTTFNTYGVDWEKNTITWYIDGNAVASMATPADMDTPMYMLLNLAVGGAGSLAGAATGASASMLIDYVRAYASGANVSSVSVATFIQEKATLDGTPFGISDTKANITADLAGLEADAQNISSITATDSPLAVSLAAFSADRSALDLLSGGFEIMDTASSETAALNSLNDPHITVIFDTTNHANGVSVAQITSDAAILAKFKNLDGSSYQLAVTDTATDIENGLSLLASDLNIQSISISSGTVSVSTATLAADLSALDKIGGGFTITDSAANLISNLAILQAASPHLGAINVSGGAPPQVSVFQFGEYRGVLDKIVGGFTVSDKATTIAAAAGALMADASHITAIYATGGAPVVSTASFTADRSVLDKVVGGFSVTDSAANIAATLDALTGDISHLTSVSLSGPADPTLSITSSQAATDSGVLNKISTPFTLETTAPNNVIDLTAYGAGVTLTAAGGSELMTGGPATNFTFESDFGLAEITNFATNGSTNSRDTLTLPSSEFANFAAVLSDARQVGSATILTAGNGDQLTLDNMTLSGLSMAAGEIAFHS